VRTFAARNTVADPTTFTLASSSALALEETRLA
jgi:hypothetical protein